MLAQVEFLETLPTPSTVRPPHSEPAAATPLQDVVEFASAEPIPDVWWLTRLHLERPRRGVRCIHLRTRCAKRMLDVAASLFLLVACAPLMLAVALAIKLTSKGPVIFQQTRVGLNLRQRRDRRRSPNGPKWLFGERRQNVSDRRQQAAYGRHFTMYKFRTMRVDAESAGPQFATHGDDRVTPIGRLLRKSRIDELPQLWNVLAGEMSLVGPRPERPEFMKELSDRIPGYLDRLGLQPGLTGVAQIMNGYDNDLDGFRRKAAFDLHYLQNCSLWNDVTILVRTVGVVLTGSGAL